jgi:hypothetical protein
LVAAAAADAVAAGLKALVGNRATRRALREAALATVDGRGAERLAAALAARAAGQARA